MGRQRRPDEPRANPPIGPHFWSVMLLWPCACAAAAWLWQGVPLADGFLAVIFGTASLQALSPKVWVLQVEGDLGMPPLVHRAAGLAEAALCVLRVVWNGTALLGWCHVATCGLMGGALWVWPWGCGRALGLVPAALVLAASTVSSFDWLAQDPLVCSLSVLAAVVGGVTARAIHQQHAQPPLPRGRGFVDLMLRHPPGSARYDEATKRWILPDPTDGDAPKPQPRRKADTRVT